jgi:small-conductance mechanosensitive channel
MFVVNHYWMTILRIILLIVVGLPLVRYLSALVARLSQQKLSKHSAQVIGNLIFYSGLTAIGVTLLHECGFNVTALLGAAGIVGIAVGFASQTSISNVISGLFLLLERPFSLGDTIKTGDVVGVAESIDLLAVRVRTSDNTLVRVPNEMVLKHILRNFTYYEHKRVDVLVSLPYEYSVAQATDLIYGMLTENSFFLSSPAPLIVMNRVTPLDFDERIRCFLSVRVWVTKAHSTQASSLLIEELKRLFDTVNVAVTITSNS